MSPTPKELSDEVCQLETFKEISPSDTEFPDQSEVRKRHVDPVPVEKDSSPSDDSGEKRVEVLYDGYYYDVTEFIKKHPGGNIIELYTESKEDATIAIQQFHYRSLKTVLARMKGLKKRQATEEEVSNGHSRSGKWDRYKNISTVSDNMRKKKRKIRSIMKYCISVGLDAETRKRHDELTKDFMALSAELQAEGIMDTNPWWFIRRLVQCFVMFVCSVAIQYYFGHTSLIMRALAVILLTLSGGQLLWLGHEGGHRSLTGFPKLDGLLHTFCFGFIFGLSASCWNSTHTEHHAMPQHETKDSDLKTMPLIAFNKRLVRDPKQNRFWLHYQHVLFILCDTCIVTLTWKFNHHIKFVRENKCYLDMVFMVSHYSLILVLGIVDWFAITWLASVYILGNLILNHTHFPVVEEGKKLHWVEYSLLNTTNCQSSWWVDWWTGHLNYQIEHHLFPAMPQYKLKFIRDRVKAFAKRHNMPYRVCSYWEAVKSTFHNLEHVAHDLKNNNI